MAVRVRLPGKRNEYVPPQAQRGLFAKKEAARIHTETPGIRSIKTVTSITQPVFRSKYPFMVLEVNGRRYAYAVNPKLARPFGLKVVSSNQYELLVRKAGKKR